MILILFLSLISFAGEEINETPSLKVAQEALQTSGESPNLDFESEEELDLEPQYLPREKWGTPQQGFANFIDYYQKEYPLKETSQKLVDNQGNGFERLYGVRNFRFVLNGLLYRSGANNAYNKHLVRDNRNPMPQEGLLNLCHEGFKNVIYLYPTNFNKKLSPVTCTTRLQNSNSMTYRQISPWTRESQHQIMKIVVESLETSSGPVLVHCWNGWHASGLISAFILRQFCSYSGEEAVAYWNKNTDGNNKGGTSDSYRKQIKDYKPFTDLKINSRITESICK